MLKYTSLVSFLLISVSTLSAHAFLTFNDSAEINPSHDYRIGVEPQFRLTDGTGINLGAFAESSLNEEWAWRAQVGAGHTDFWAAGSAKWVPIPDYDKQPGIGVRPEFIFGRDESETFTILRASPFVSKKLETEIGVITPYAAMPISLLAWRGKSDNLTQLVLGSEGKFDQIPDILFSAEIGLNLGNTFTYIAGTASFFFGNSKK